MLATPGRRAVARFADAIGMRRVAFPAGKWDPFLNVNTPDDLAMARSLVPRAGEGQP
jgi:molybdopterin-guanine dinucleotide biosynthesis protein A